MRFILGTDPETFLSLGGQFVSAHGLFPGTKKEPYKVDKGAIQVDGVALEFNIDPVDNMVDWNRNIETVLLQMKEMVQKVDKDMILKFEPIASFDKKYFDNIPIEAKILGCDPDFNFQGKMNPAPKLQDVPLRTAAGHIHIGWTEGENPNSASHFEDARFISDKFYRSGIFTPKLSSEQERLRYYGMYGSFRPKSYGVELRSPSNLWVETPESRMKMFSKVMTQMQELV